MTESEVRVVLEWGWTSYKKLPWCGNTARHPYTFRLRSETATRVSETCTIQFGSAADTGDPRDHRQRP